MIKSSKYKLIMNTPAAWYKAEWKDALPTGNGIVGASVYGAVKDETILVNHSALWHGGVRNPVPDISSSLQMTRDFMKQHKYEEANEVSSRMLLDAGYVGELYKPCPIADIKILMEHEQPFQKYERSLDMETGEVTVSWNCNDIAYKRTVFVSRQDGLIVCRFEADKSKFTAEVFLQLHKSSHDDYQKFQKGVKAVHVNTLDENMIGMEVEAKEQCFGLLGKVLYCDGSISSHNQRICIKDASEVIIVFEPYVLKPFDIALQGFKNRIKDIPTSYRELSEPHIRLHKPLFHSAELTLGKEEESGETNEELLLHTYKNGASNALIEKLWHYGRYLFISGTSDQGYPFALYGLWGGEYDLLWSHNMANINIQMIYWHALAGGYVDYLRAVINYYYELLDDFRVNAKNIFGLNGIWVPAGSTPGFGVANQVVPVIMNWIGGAGWLCQHFYDYYRYTGDEALLEEKILPFMLEAAQFYEEYLILENGEYSIIPSVSPENTPRNLNKGSFHHMSHACPTAKNATMDIAIIKELMTNLTSLCFEKKVHQDKCILWNKIIDKLPAYQINDDKAIKEWACDEFTDFYYHRHLSHCYPVFPGKEITKENAPELFEAFINSIDLRILGGQSGWSLAYMAQLNARLQRGEDAYRSLDILCKACLTSSFMSLHNDWRKMGLTLDMSDELRDEAPVQLDANMGLVGAVQEMLLYHDASNLRLLPAIPKKWSSGRFTDFHLQRGLISCEWDTVQKQISITVIMDSDQVQKLYLPDFISGKSGRINEIQIDNLKKEEPITLNCKKHETISICIGLNFLKE